MKAPPLARITLLLGGMPRIGSNKVNSWQLGKMPRCVVGQPAVKWEMVPRCKLRSFENRFLQLCRDHIALLEIALETKKSMVQQGSSITSDSEVTSNHRAKRRNTVLY